MVRLTKGLERAVLYARAAQRTRFTAIELASAAEIPARTARAYCQMLTKATILEKAYTYPPSYRYTGRKKISKCWEPLLDLVERS